MNRSVLAELLDRGCGGSPQDGSVVRVGDDRGICLTELRERAREFAETLLAREIGPGSRVAVAATNSAEYLTAVFAVARTGAGLVPMNIRFACAELAWVLDDADIDTVLIFDPNPARLRLQERLGEAAAACGRTWRADAAGGTGALRMFDLGPRFFSARPRRPAACTDGRVIIYTSGSTSRPKGAVLEQEALVSTATSYAQALELRGGDRVWVPGPWSHIGGIQLSLAAISVGASLYSAPRFDAAEAARLILEQGITVAYPGFVAMTSDLVKELPADADLSSLRLVGTSGSEADLRRAQQAWPGATQFTVYGSTETGGVIVASSLTGDLDHRVRTVGFPFGGARISIRDEGGTEVPAGQPGEMWVDGPGLFRGYLSDEGIDSSGVVEGRGFRSGDRGMRTSDGEVCYLGRVKEMIKVGGENVAPSEIESAIAELPEVKLCQVVAIPDARYDEVPVAFVELHAGDRYDEARILRHCRGRLARFKNPVAIHQVDQWPMVNTKVDKKVLQARARGDGDATSDLT